MVTSDFGLSKVCVSDIDGAMNVCVTPEHIAPEVLEAQPCTKAADWWSFGILPYEMIGGRPPYYHPDNDTVFQAIRNQERIVFSPSYSDSAVSLILGLLTRDPTMRLGSGPRDAGEVLTHPFFESISWPGLLEKRIPPQVTVVSTRTTRHARTTLGSQGPSSVESNVFSGHQ